MGNTGAGAALGRFQQMEGTPIKNTGCVIIGHAGNVLI
jgi:hypothetical protein